MKTEEARALLEKALLVRDKLKQTLTSKEAEVRTLESQLEVQVEALRKDYGADSLEALEALLETKREAVAEAVVRLKQAMDRYEADLGSANNGKEFFGKEFGDV